MVISIGVHVQLRHGSTWSCSMCTMCTILGTHPYAIHMSRTVQEHMVHTIVLLGVLESLYPPKSVKMFLFR